MKFKLNYNIVNYIDLNSFIHFVVFFIIKVEKVPLFLDVPCQLCYGKLLFMQLTAFKGTQIVNIVST